METDVRYFFLLISLLAPSFALAFDKSDLDEAIEMAVLSKNMNGDGSTEMGTPITISGFGQWSLKWEGKDENASPDKFGGFRKYCNRWAVFKSTKSDKTYAIVLRGTINNTLSIVEDALATTVKANSVWFKDNDSSHQGKAHAIQLSNDEQAEVHVGFAGGLVDTLFHRGGDEENPKGLIRILNSKIEPDSTIYITGHSQGAAIATLLHSFLISRNLPLNTGYGLSDKSFKIKSYVFAQPKPGNWDYAMDFSRALFINASSAYVINNSWDWVPQAPISVQLPSEFTTRLLQSYSGSSKPIINDVIGFAGNYAKIESSLRTGLSAAVRGIEANVNTVDEIKGRLTAELPTFTKEYIEAQACEKHAIPFVCPPQPPPPQTKLLNVVFKDASQGIFNKLGSFSNDLDSKYLFDQGPVEPKDGSSVNYTPVGNLVALPMSAQASVSKDDLTLQHHMKLYIQGLCEMRKSRQDCPEAPILIGGPPQ